MSLAVLVANLGAQKHDADSRLARGRARSLVGTTGVLANLSSAKSSACRDQAPRKSKKLRPVGEVRLRAQQHDRHHQPAFAEWREVFPNAACVVSLVDRLVHNGCTG